MRNKINIPLGIFFFICDPRFPDFAEYVVKNRKILEIKIWDYMSQTMPECKALGGVKIHIIDTYPEWGRIQFYHQQASIFRQHSGFGAPPIPEFVYRIPSINNVIISHPELSDICPFNNIDNDAIGYTFTSKGWPFKEDDTDWIASTIANDFKEKTYEYNESNLLRYSIQVATKFKLPPKSAKELMMRAVWESEVDLLAMADNKNLSYYEDDVLWCGICDKLPDGFVSMLVKEVEMENYDEMSPQELLEYDYNHYYSEENELVFNNYEKVHSAILTSMAKTELFELRHTEGCPGFYRIDFNNIDTKQNNNMYLADEYIERYNASSYRDFVNEWIDKHSDKDELKLVEQNGKGKWNTCHEYYLEEAASFIVQSASSSPNQTRFGKDGIDFVKNGRKGQYAYHPLKEFPFLCMVHTLYTQGDSFKYDFEKREKLFGYLQCYHNKEFHEFIKVFYGISREESNRDDKQDNKEVNATLNNFKTKKKAGRRAISLEQCIISDNKDAMIEEMKKNIAVCNGGPDIASYLKELKEDGLLSRFPSYIELNKVIPLKITEGPYNAALKLYR